MGSSVGKFYNCDHSNIDTITDINKIVNCVQNNTLKDIISGSASPSLQYIFDFNNTTYYNNERLERGFMKLFISNSLDMKLGNSYSNLKARFDEIETTSTFPVDMRDEIFAVNYEYHIYRYIVKPLLDNHISPHFVKYIGGILDTRFTNLTKFLSDKSGVDYFTLLSNFKVNLDSMLSTNIDKTKLSKAAPAGRKALVSDRLGDFEYGFILLEGLSYTNDVKNIRIGQSGSLFDYLNEYGKSDVNMIYKILFQIATALYALTLTRTIHNDLHTGNAYIKKTERHINQYIIDDKIYTLQTDFETMIYDFDRAYHKGYVNDLLNNNFIKHHSQSNDFIEAKDIAKVVGGVYESVDDPTKSDLLDIILKDKNNAADRKFWDDVFNKGSFLQKSFSVLSLEPLAVDDYKSLDTYPNIIQKIYDKISNPNPAPGRIDPDKVYTYYCNENMFRPDGSINVSSTYEKVKSLQNRVQLEKSDKERINTQLDMLQDDYDELKNNYDELDREHDIAINEAKKYKILSIKTIKEEGEISDSDED